MTELIDEPGDKDLSARLGWGPTQTLFPVNTPKSDWQPIETAPHDGYFLAYIPQAKGNKIKIVRRFGLSGFKPMHSNDVLQNNPTHWQHLPNPPEVTQ